MYEMTAHRPAFKAFVSWAILLTGERFLGVIHLKINSKIYIEGTILIFDLMCNQGVHH
jgi:hypothetical protein